MAASSPSAPLQRCTAFQPSLKPQVGMTTAAAVMHLPPWEVGGWRQSAWKHTFLALPQETRCYFQWGSLSFLVSFPPAFLDRHPWEINQGLNTRTPSLLYRSRQTGGQQASGCSRPRALGNIWAGQFGEQLAFERIPKAYNWGNPTQGLYTKWLLSLIKMSVAQGPLMPPARALFCWFTIIEDNIISKRFISGKKFIGISVCPIFRVYLRATGGQVDEQGGVLLT